MPEQENIIPPFFVRSLLKTMGKSVAEPPSFVSNMRHGFRVYFLNKTEGILTLVGIAERKVLRHQEWLSERAEAIVAGLEDHIAVTAREEAMAGHIDNHRDQMSCDCTFSLTELRDFENQRAE